MFYSLIWGVTNNDYKNMVLEHSDPSDFMVEYFTLYISQVFYVLLWTLALQQVKKCF